MKINTQFRLLAGGIILLPLLTGLAFLLLDRFRNDEAGYVAPTYEEMLPLFDGSLERQEWDNIADTIVRARLDTSIVVFRKDMKVVYSTSESFTLGQVLSDMELLDMVKAGGTHFGYVLESRGWTTESHAYMLIWVDQDRPRPPNPVKIVALSFFFFVVTVLVFVIGMSGMIARSITKSVLVLENATRRIAEGELDLSVDVKGSNEITSLTASLNRMRLALKEEENRRSRFIMGITHDLKTPLALIKGYAEAIEDGIADDPESRIRSVEIIAAKVDQLEGMIDDLMDFIRVDTGEWRQNLSQVNLYKTLTSYGWRMEDDAGLLNRRFEAHVELPENLTVPMDERLALRAIENLINNALRYTGPGGLIQMNAYIQENKVVIEVCDNGPGIDGADLSRIFETFYRGSSSRREQGMGLGLAVVKGVTDSHGWTITVESEKGKGSCFRIHIPLK